MRRPITDQEYRRILRTIRSLTAVDELAAYRAELRTLHRGDPKLARVERAIDWRANALIAAATRQP